MIGRISMGMAAAIPFFNEFAQAQQAARDMQGGRRMGGGGERMFDPDAVVISSNENPMGPSKEGLDAMLKVAPLGWRYHPQGANIEFDALLHRVENVKQGYVIGYPGSSQPLAQCVPAFTSPSRPWVMGSPGYGSGGPRWVGSKVVKVPLRRDYSHDVEAMIKADPNAGAYYICNPNNPSGTLTSPKDFQYILDNKPKGAVLIIDEAYVHFADPWKTTSMELVRQDKDVVILRTFSKIYGMAGLRAGAIYGRPDLLAKVSEYGRANFMPVTATACAAASMKAIGTIMPERIALNKT
ncbi:MAG: aminotransferase class I/II-fold pyridoxal phosphate-dependent enzyme, partial [Acidobacteriota bacterium]|nr:aminotransferase class I/II-fold pyridoxal phosphate-dependent enzyme [Acidobacteriota bacterium]